MKNCLIVLGMHRSGTSALTGILDLLGVNTGTKILETEGNNSRSVFENKSVGLACDRILESLNSAWDDPIPLPPNWPARFENSQLLEDARTFLRTDIPDNQLSALHDPRLCRLLPFWLPLLTAENITPRIALVIRNPLEVADSLQGSNGFSIEKSLVLWMQYMLEAERNTRHLPRDSIRFDSILDNPQQSIERLFQNVDLDTPNFSAVPSEELDKFLDRGIHHHDASDEDLKARCHPTIADYYRLLCKISEGEALAGDLEAFDVLGDQFQFDQKLAHNQDIARPVIVHCHLFKNAGTTLDWSLQRQFGSKFFDHRDDDNMRRGAVYLKPYLETHRQLSAISSHHVRFPLPISEELHLLPLIALRHPFDRARSVYDYERRQDGNSPGAIHAKKLSFAEYVRWRMQPEVAPTIRNFQCSFCTSTFDSTIGEQAYMDSVAMLMRTPLLVIVERYDESMVLLEHHLEKYFPGIDLSYIRQNETSDRETELAQRIHTMFEELGPELSVEFREKNHWDMKLYESALWIHGERLGALDDVDRLIGNIQTRCRLLSVAT